MLHFPEEVESHINEVKGDTLTRFPPEPNGFLHIGHAFAMLCDFNVGKKCYLRFDDTNPKAEEQQYVDAAIEMVKWLGYEPYKITYTSDYFDQLYELAERLILECNAYVCGCHPDVITLQRSEQKPCSHRDRDPTESLELFRQMKNDNIGEGVACLRMKGDLNDPDPCMWDLVMYRVIKYPHYRTGTKWVVYPSYDFSHCLVDSLEGIHISLCTTEFITRRKSYYWLIEKLGLPHRPYVYEFGKVSVSHSIISKRRLHQLVSEKVVNGWDDPRLLTLAGLRRRGYTPEAINSFVSCGGFNRIDVTLPFSRLEKCLRDNLDETAPRRFGVIDPIEVVLPDDPMQEVLMFDFPIHWKTNIEDDVPETARGTRKVKVTKLIFINRKDFRVEESGDYYGLTPNKTKVVRLKYTDIFIRCTGYQIDYATNIVSRVFTEYVTGLSNKQIKKIKGVLSWVGDDAIKTEFRMYQPLFREENPTLANEPNPESLVIMHGLVEPSISIMRFPGSRFQLERLGFFAVDKDTTDDILVLNLSVPLKSSFE